MLTYNELIEKLSSLDKNIINKQTYAEVYNNDTVVLSVVDVKKDGTIIMADHNIE